MLLYTFLASALSCCGVDSSTASCARYSSSDIPSASAVSDVTSGSGAAVTPSAASASSSLCILTEEAKRDAERATRRGCTL